MLENMSANELTAIEAARRLGIDLDGFWRRREAHTFEGAARRLDVTHEVADVVQKNLVADRKLSVGLRHAAGKPRGCSRKSE